MDIKPLGQPQPLNRAAAHNAVTRLNAALSPAIRDLAHRLLSLLGDDGSASVAEVHQQLFPLANARTASAQFSNLLAAIKKAADTQGLALDWGFEGSKQAGTAKRKFRFLGPRPSHVADLEGLERIPPEQRIDGQRGLVLGDIPCVVLITFNEHEFAAVRATFWQTSPSQPEPTTESKGGLVVDLLGFHGGLRVLHHHCRQGNRESQRAATSLHQHFNPRAILAMGIAFGIDGAKQGIGDVLVSNFIVDYELGRVGRGGSLSLRGSRPPASRRLLEALRQIDTRRNASTSHPDWPRLHFGGLLSGEKLVDNLDYRDALRALHGGDDLIGGEMEAAGLFTALDGHGVDWIVIKAICDWADGHKGQDKTRRQQLAATNAAAVAKALLTEGSLYPDSPPPKRPLKPALSEFVACHPFADGQKGRHTDLDTLRARLREEEREQSQAAAGVIAMDDLLAWARSDDGPQLYALLAEYGMGKTTHCQRLYDTLRKLRAEGHKDRTPLYFDLRKVERLQAASATSPGLTPNLQEVIEDCLRHGYLQPDGQPPRYEDALDEIDQGALVIFDGLDEVLSRIGDKQGLSFVANLLKVIPETAARGRAEAAPKVLLSCRTQFFRNLTEQNNQLTGGHRGAKDAPQFRALELQPFEDEQIRAYLTSLFPNGETDALMAQIEAIHNLRELTERPFTLKLVGQFIPLIERWRAQGHTITGATLYRQVAREWLIRDREKQSFQPEDKERIAADLAAHLWRNNQRGLPARDLEAWLSQWLAAQDPHADFQLIERSLLQQDLRNATFLRRVDQGDDSRFEFAHSSLQEFLLAEYLRLALVDAVQAPATAQAARQRWALREVSAETLDFLGQMLTEATQPGTADLLAVLAGWRAPYLAQVSERLLDYGLRAYQRGWPRPRLDGIDLQGADLSDRHFGSAGEQPLNALLRLDLRGANFQSALLRRARFWNVDLAEACFGEAIATQAEFQHCGLGGSQWASADTAGAVCRPLDSTPWQPRPAEPAPNASLLPVLGRPGGLGNQSISPDGSWMATGGTSLRLWDVRSGECLRALSGHDGGITACAIAPDGSWIASASRDRTLRLWNARSGDCLRVLSGHENWVTACAIAPDSSWIASADDDGTLRLWDAHSGECLRVLNGHQDWVTACAIAPDGSWIASASHDRTLRLWDARSGECLRVLSRHEAGVTACAIAPDGSWIVSASHDRTLRLWDARSGECLRVLSGHEDWVTACAIAPDGSWIASAGDDNTLRRWNARSGECLRVLSRHEAGVTACAIAPDGSWIASTGHAGTLRLWDARSGECLRVLSGHSRWVNACAIAPDGHWIASASSDGRLHRWDAHSGECLHLLSGNDCWVNACAITPDSRWIVSAGDDGMLRLLDSNSGECLRVLYGHKGWLRACAVAPDGSWIASAGDDGTLRLWDARSSQCMHVLSGHKRSVAACAIAPDGSWIVSAGDDSTLRLWDARTGDCLRVLSGHEREVTACAIAPDGSWIASASHDRTLRLWDAHSGECVRVLYGHEGWVTTCAIAPDGSWIVSADDDGMLRLWDARSGECLRVLSRHEAGVTACAIAPDGNWIASSSRDGTLRRWQSEIGDGGWIALCTRGGAAAWSATESTLRYASGTAWRALRWQSLDAQGWPQIAPLEAMPGLQLKPWPPQPANLPTTPQQSSVRPGLKTRA